MGTIKFAIGALLLGLFIYQWKLYLPKSWYEPKIGDIGDFLKSHGYPLEEHHVQTEDGYILTVHRITHGRNEDPSDYRKTKPPVFLMHGLLLSSMDWIVLGPDKAMGLILADAGYDVWLGNNRGNTYSRSHITLNPDTHKKQFYNYSYNEIGIFDIPAMIDYVIDTTGYKKISYIGFSEGVTSFLVMGSLRPEYNKKILLMNAFAPVTDAYNITSILFNILAISPKILKLADFIGWYEMFDHTASPIFILLCQVRPVCNTLFYSIGVSREQLPDQDFQLTAVSNFPAGMSLNQITHYIQGTRTGKFEPLRSGTDKNAVKVVYDLTKVTAPIIIYYGEADNLVNNHALLNTVAKELPNVVKIYKVPYPKFNHLDFLWGKDIRLLTEEALNNINLFNNRSQ